MARAYKLVVALVFLFTVILVSGCYTIVGHPSVVEEGIVDAETEEIVEDRVYEYYGPEYGRTYPYYLDYYDLWYPRSYYYWNGPRWYYNDYPTRYYYDYDGHYVPEKKPETKRRGATDTWRSLRSRDRSETAPEQDRETDQPRREIRSRRRTENRSQRAPTQRRDTTTQRRSTKRKAPDEEEETKN